jgi:TRAP-type C4-dicarboxylate transport system substrate-binding protein
MTMQRLFTATTLLALLLLPARVLAVDFKIATLAPDGTAWMQEMRAGAALIAERTRGRVGFKFYPGGAMGNDKSVLRKIRAGQLHGGALTGGGLAEVYPDNQIYSLPLIFRSYEELDYVRARMDELMIQGFAGRGFVSFGLAEGGFAYLMSREPVKTTADLKNLKVWVPEGDVITRTVFDALGVAPVSLPLTDVMTGLETGLISTIGASPSGAIAMQWHTRVKYVTDAPLMYFYGTLVIAQRAFDRTSPADQKIVREIMQDVYRRLNRQARVDNNGARAALERQGVEFLPLPAAELDKLRSLAGDAIERLGKQGVYTQSMFRTLESHLQAYRRSHPMAAHRP